MVFIKVVPLCDFAVPARQGTLWADSRAVGHTEEDRQACSGPMARSHGIVIGGGAKRERLLGKRPRRAGASRTWGFDICGVCLTEYGPSYYFGLLLGLADFPPSRFSTVAFDSVGDALFEGW